MFHTSGLDFGREKDGSTRIERSIPEGGTFVAVLPKPEWAAAIRAVEGKQDAIVLTCFCGVMLATNEIGTDRPTAAFHEMSLMARQHFETAHGLAPTGA